VKLRVRGKFWQDVERHQLWLLKNANAEIADRWFEALWESVTFLCSHPEAGRLRRDLKHPGVRSWLVEDFRRWTIFYGVRENVLVLYRVEGGETDLRLLAV
jgi:plasmid stabilization system protein ParE